MSSGVTSETLRVPSENDQWLTLSASPRLKDADISKSKLPRLYGELLVAMRRMYHSCQLVHADLSEYNIL